MCEIFDGVWQYALGFLLLISIVTLLLRAKHARAAKLPSWLAHVLFWGQGFVALFMLLLMVLAFVCTGSPGDIKGIIPN